MKIRYLSYLILILLFYRAIPLVAVELNRNAMAEYHDSRLSLTDDEIHKFLKMGMEWEEKTHLSETLVQGGSAFFPHAYIRKCGEQIAAVVQSALIACKKSGKNQILVLGVVHSPLKEELKQARWRELSGKDLSKDSYRGIYGPGLLNEERLSNEFSLDNFIFLYSKAIEKMEEEPPKLIIRFPFLVNGEPNLLPGIEELEIYAKDSIVIATGDLCHQGVAYGSSPLAALDLSEPGTAYARRSIEANLQLLHPKSYLSFRDHCIRFISDTLDVGQVLVHLLGPLRGSIHDLKLVDTKDFYEGDLSPSWVATALVELVPLKE